MRASIFRHCHLHITCQSTTASAADVMHMLAGRSWQACAFCRTYACLPACRTCASCTIYACLPASSCKHVLLAGGCNQPILNSAAAAAFAHSALHSIEPYGSRSNCWVGCCIEDAADRFATRSRSVACRLAVWHPMEAACNGCHCCSDSMTAECRHCLKQNSGASVAKQHT
jgi:hypothetical protein